MNNNQRLCPVCHKANPATSGFCSQCGTALSAAPGGGAPGGSGAPGGPGLGTAPALQQFFRSAGIFGLIAALLVITIPLFVAAKYARDAFAYMNSPSYSGSAYRDENGKSLIDPEEPKDASVRVNSSAPFNEIKGKADSYGTERAVAGRVFLVCNVTVTNVSSRTIYVGADSGVSGFKLHASDKHVYVARIPGFGPFETFAPLSATLEPGGTETGDLSFEVPSGVTGVSIERY